MIKIPGRKRVVISNIQPAVDEGRFPAKAVQYFPVTISADVFADGHDEIQVQLRFRQVSHRSWTTVQMNFCENDRWEYHFEPNLTGIYQFQLSAWVDHYASWKKKLEKKWQAGMDIGTEIRNGVMLIAGKLSTVKKTERTLLEQWSQKLAAAAGEDAVILSRDETVGRIAGTSVPSDTVTSSMMYMLESERPKALFSTWYELFPRSCGTQGTHGTFKDVIDLLPEIAHMGFDVLYLPPIHPIGRIKRKGKNNSLTATDGDPGSPWAIGSTEGGHKAIHPQLGTLRDFRALVKAAGKQGIDIAMDIALQCAPDHPYVAQHPEWFRWNADGQVQYAENPPKKYEDILPFDFESDAWETLWEELKSIFLFWIDKGVKVFRVDNPHTKSLAFWEWVIREIKEEHTDVLFLAEAFTRPRIMEQLAKAGFSQSYTYFTWRSTRQELQTYLKELTQPPLSLYFRPNFWPNTPDILPPELTHGGINAHIIRLILAATLSSSYGIYGPVFERGICEPAPGKEEYVNSEKYEIHHWERGMYTKIREIVIRVNRIRKQQPALQQFTGIRFLPTDNQQLIAYIKESPKEAGKLLIVVNLDPFNTQSGWVDLPIIRTGSSSCKIHDLLGGDTYIWQSGKNYVSLNPNDLPAHIFLVQ